ncbi:MAG: MBL fold metallo-hydrolase, partial [Fimbriimonadaceae bacterium]
MILKRVYEENLAQASYLVGCAASGVAIVIDPNRDIEKYLELAHGEGLRIVAVAETHIHADYLSGSLELARLTGAKLYLSDEGGQDWKYDLPEAPFVHLVRDGDQFQVGNLRFDVLATPGHTPEHISFVLTDLPATADPYGVFTGDFIFVGDVGRPDLLERAAGFEGTMAQGAADLFHSIQRFLSK